MAKYLMAIACEEYGDAKITGAAYAEKDATAFAQAWGALGIDAEDQILLVDTTATKSTVESRLRRLLNNADESDSIVLYYVGHAFSQNDETYLTCADAQRADLAETSVSLQWLCDRLSKSECRRIALFLDLRRLSLGDAGLGKKADEPSDDEIERLFDAADNCVAFVSCRAGESSWATGRVNHSIWSHHVIEALLGDAKRALAKNRYLTPDSLQEHLLDAVPRTLAISFTDGKQQTPWRCGGLPGDEKLADFQEIFAKRKAADANGANQILKATLSREHTAPIKTLAGFNKGMKAPDRVSPFAAQLVSKLAADDLSEDLKTKHAQLKREFKFKRTDMDVSGPADGAGTIITPYFTYYVTVTQSASDPSAVVWRRTVTDVKDAKRVLSAEFTRVFEKDFDTIALTSPTAIDLDDFIDRVEALEDERIVLNYDPNPTSVSVSVKGVEGELHVDKKSMWFGRPGPASPNELAASLMKIQRTLVDEKQTPLLSSGDAGAK